MVMSITVLICTGMGNRVLTVASLCTLDPLPSVMTSTGLTTSFNGASIPLANNATRSMSKTLVMLALIQINVKE